MKWLQIQFGFILSQRLSLSYSPKLQEVWCGTLKEQDGSEVVTGYWEWGISVLSYSLQARRELCPHLGTVYKFVTNQKNNFFPSKNQDSCLYLAVFPQCLLWVSSAHHLAKMRRVAFPTTPAIWKTLSASFLPINSPSVLKSHDEMHPWSFASTS